MEELQIDAHGRVHRVRAAPRAGHGFNRILFAEDLAELLLAGLTVREALMAMAQGHARTADRGVLQGLLQRITAGTALSDAMAQDHAAFGDVLVALVRAGERTSGLAESLQRHARTARRLDELRNRTVTALVYPALLLSVGLAVLVFLLGWVLPGFSDVLQDGAEQLTPLARAILGLGAWLGAHRGLWVLALLCGAVTLGLVWMQPPARLALMQLVSRLPGLAGTLQLLHASRFFSTVATLTQGGLSAVSALELATPLLLPEGQRHLAEAVVRLRTGQPLAQSLSPSTDRSLFGDDVVGRLLEVGQRTGELPRTLERISALLEARTTRRVERLSRSLEPLLMVLLGVLVGAVVLMMYVPLIELSAGMP